MTFLEIASANIARGLNVIPLRPKDKAPFQPDWTAQATNQLPIIEGWNRENPDYNCGAVTNKETYWILDVDCMDWWMDQFPPELLPIKTYSVATGGGGRHYYFLHDDESREAFGKVRHLANPEPGRWKKANGDPCDSVVDVLGHNAQALVAGCIHPKTGRAYEVHTDLPLSVAPLVLLQWLKGKFDARKKSSSQNTSSTDKNPFEVVKGFDPKVAFLNSGLLFAESTKDGCIFFNYHKLMGKCLVKGEKHIGDGGANENNNECSAFVWNPTNRQLWHKCQAAACDSLGKHTAVRKALGQIGIDWKNIYSPSDGQAHASMKITWANDIVAEHMQWLWPGYLPSNKLLTFVGASTQGKSPVTMDLAARVSRGMPWPDGKPNELGPRNVFVLSSEDDWKDTIKPRLILAGADCSRIGQLQVSVTKQDSEHIRAARLDVDLQHLADAIAADGNVGLVIIDPITNYLGKIKMNAEDEVRSLLMPIAVMCQDLNVCIIIVCHVNKRSDTSSAMQRVMGAAAFAGVSRGIFFFDSDKDEEDKYAHVMIPQRIVAPTMKYKTVAEKLDWPGPLGTIQTSEVVKVVWGGVSDSTDDDFGKAPSSKVKAEQSEAVTLLKQFLAKGVKKSAAECGEFLKQGGYVLQNLGGSVNANWLCKKAGVKKTSDKGRWFWSIPDTTTLNDEPIPEQGDMDFDPTEFMDKEEL